MTPKGIFYSYTILAFMLVSCSISHAQSESITMSVPFRANLNIAKIKNDWMVKVQNLSSPLERNSSYQAWLKPLKEESALKFPRKASKTSNNTINKSQTSTPQIAAGFEANDFDFSTPNDNTVAISRLGILISVKNSNIHIIDTGTDSLLKAISLKSFADTLGLDGHHYDPRILYDPDYERFVFICLSGTADSNSNIVLGFSQSIDPMGEWNLYYLPGNPLNDSSWTDFPAAALSEGELFITANLLKNGETWQTSFKQSVIWQIDKKAAYSGCTLKSKLWHNININDTNIRNLHPVQGGNFLHGPEMSFLSNKNFSILCDSIFLIRINDTIDAPSQNLTVNILKTDVSYGLPPDALQYGLNKLATNDSRILDAFYQNNKIQFVLNTIDTSRGGAAIYHGFIHNSGNYPYVKGFIISDSLLDYGYPAISYCGNNLDQDYSIISYCYTAPTVYAGFAATFIKQQGNISDRLNLKSGDTFVKLLSGNLERWGDYSGSQPDYSVSGRVWVSGSFGKKKKIGLMNFRTHGTWVAALDIPEMDEPLIIPNNFEVGAWPNPGNDMIYLKLELPETAILEISLFNINGQKTAVVHKGEVKAGSNIISFSIAQLAQGIYILRITDGYKQIHTQKLIKS